LAEDRLLLLGSTTNLDSLQQHLTCIRGQFSILEYDAASAYACIGLVGPHTREILSSLTFLDVSEASLPPGSCAETSVAGIPTLLVCPPNSASTIQCLVGWDLAEYFWERLLEAGSRCGLTAMGSNAWVAGHTE
jgi:sarcosine oxidase gamma subunit